MYNWDNEYEELYWVIKSHGFNPEDSKLEKLLEDVFTLGHDLGYEECLEHNNI